MGSPPLLDKEDEQRDSPIDGTEDGPVGRAVALEAGVDDILRLVRLVGLRNEAAAVSERDPGWQRGAGETS